MRVLTDRYGKDNGNGGIPSFPNIFLVVYLRVICRISVTPIFWLVSAWLFIIAKGVSASASMGYLTSEVLPSTMNCIFSQFIRISSEELLRIIISHWESFGINL